MVPNSLSANEDEKLAKLEVETSHQTSTTIEGDYTMIDTGSNVGSNKKSKECDKLKVRYNNLLTDCVTM